MISQINAILIIGGTSGIDEAFARLLHRTGKKVVIVGVRADKLSALASELPGAETV